MAEMHKPLLREGDTGYTEMNEVKKTEQEAEHKKGGVQPLPLTSFNAHGLTSAEAQALLLKWGRNELVEKTTPLWRLVLKYFWGTEIYKPNPITLLLWIACIISGATKDFFTFSLILLLIIVNGCIAWFENAKANNAVAALKAALSPKAFVCRDRNWGPIDAGELVPGDLIMLKLGDVAPADCVLAEGQTMDLDQSGLTGESLPVTKNPGEFVFSGTAVKRGEGEAFVQFTGEHTEMGKAATLIQSVEAVGNFQAVLSRIAYVLVAVALVLVIILLFVQIFHNDIDPINVVTQALVLLVASVPIAMPVVCTTTMAVGARRLAENSAIVTRLSAVEELAGMTVLCSDKTGTLTLNQLTLYDPWTVDPSISGDEIKFQAALACKRIDPDAIDTATLKFCPNPQLLSQFEQDKFLPFDPSNRRTEATLRNTSTGETHKVTKGAPQVILKMAANRTAIEADVNRKIVEFADRGYRSLGVARTLPGRPDDEWYMMGILSLYDPPRPDSKDVIERAALQGVSVKMITGDHLLIAKETARQLGMGVNILPSHKLHDTSDRKVLADLVMDADGFAEVFPDDKFNIVALVQEKGHTTGMTGDGVNDAPALKKAQCGFAVAGATPAAQGAASVVLSTPGLSVIITAIVRSRKIFQRMNNYAIYRINVSMQLLLFFFLSNIALQFQLPAFVVVLMALLNDATVMSIAYDKVLPSNRPEFWRVAEVSILGFCIAAVHVGISIFVLILVQKNFFSYQSANFFGMTELLVPQQRAVMFLQLSLSAQFSVYTARTSGLFFSRRPGFVLLGAMTCQMFISTMLALFWPGNIYTPDSSTVDVQKMFAGPGSWIAFVWGVNLIGFLIADVFKVLIRVIIDRVQYTDEDRARDVKAEVRRRVATVQGQRMPAPHAAR